MGRPCTIGLYPFLCEEYNKVAQSIVQLLTTLGYDSEIVRIGQFKLTRCDTYHKILCCPATYIYINHLKKGFMGGIILTQKAIYAGYYYNLFRDTFLPIKAKWALKNLLSTLAHLAARSRALDRHGGMRARKSIL